MEINISKNNSLTDEKIDIDLDYLDKVPKEERHKFVFEKSTINKCIKYINANGKNKYLVMDAIIKIFDKKYESEGENYRDNEKYKDGLSDIAEKLKRHDDLAIFIIKLGFCRNDIFTFFKDDFLNRIMILAIYSTKNELYDNNAALFLREVGKSKGKNKKINSNEIKDLLIEQVHEYVKIKEIVANLPSEEEKTNFLMSIDNDFIKESLLDYEIKQKENRLRIIKSIKNKISPEIKPEVKLSQKMIFEFLEDNLNCGITNKDIERVFMAFKATDVIFDENYNHIGCARPDYLEIEINNANPIDVVFRIQVLLHEYGHIIRGLKTTERGFRKHEMEEGTQNIFAQEVLNHYIKKHGNIIIEGKKIKPNYPIIIRNAYMDYESWMKTFMYLQEDNGKDIEVLLDYELGKDRETIEMTLGKDKIKSYSINGVIAYRYLEEDEIYEANKEKFRKINKKSKYYADNSILKRFEKEKIPNEDGPEL